MTEVTQSRSISALNRVCTGLALATFLLGFAFMVALINRGIDALFGWEYGYKSIGDFLGLGGPHKGLLTIDRSFLLLAGAVAAGAAAYQLDRFQE